MHHRPELHHWCQGYMEIQLMQIVALYAMIQSVRPDQIYCFTDFVFGEIKTSIT